MGSAYEGAGKYPEATYATPDFSLFAEKSRFTDDTVLTVALADALLTEERDFAGKLRDYTKKYPERRYGKGFLKRVKGDLSDEFAGKSFTNGSAMRVIPVAWAAKDLEEALNLAAETAKISHDHPEGIKGAQAIASAVYLAKS
ncbi:MAG: ADP-ribosylglycohydrolase family protein [Candidatus Peribacteria bacterium]|nr:ADP-ribosylglycohydrolase family protein [Candidatus Peribacteria bacterium]